MSEVESVKREPEFAALVSIDWADKKHRVVLASRGHGETGERRTGAHSGSGGGLGRSIVPTFQQSSHRRGVGAIARSSSVHVE